MKSCAFITLFNPKKEQLIINIEQIEKYTDKIYLLLNSPLTELSEPEFLKENICVIKNPRNVGLSKAFNDGFKIAINEGYEIAILFDQDSFLSLENFGILYDEYIQSNNKSKIMCIGPSLNIYGNVITTPKWSLKKTNEIFENADCVKNIITSGMIVNLRYALDIGGFSENYPVDFCDFFFCWKALYNGYLVLKSKDAFIVHEIGNSQMKIGKSTIHFHAPYRNYFLVRDTLNICFREKETPLMIRIRYFFFLLPRMILFIIKCDRKMERLNMYYLGFKDFLHDRRGFGSISKLLGAE